MDDYLYNNLSSSYRQRSQTLQPGVLPKGKKYVLLKYLEQQLNPDKANYANVPLDIDRPPTMPHFHTRTRSQHYYHQPTNSYYNVTNIPPRDHPHRGIHCTLPPMHDLSPPETTIDPIRLMQFTNEIGPVDTAPLIPQRRNYTICGSRDGGFYKLTFPQQRFTTADFVVPILCTTIPARSAIVVIGHSSERSKFVAFYKGIKVDIPHNLTQLAVYDQYN